MGTVYDMRTRREKCVDGDYENHLDGWCNGPSINEKDNHYCRWCEEDRQRQQYEDTRKAKACADAFKPLLWAVDQVFGRK